MEHICMSLLVSGGNTTCAARLLGMVPQLLSHTLER